MIIEKAGYTVELKKTHAVVSGGKLTRPVKVAKLLSAGDANPKTAKNKVVTFGLSLAPHKQAAIGNLCPHAKTCIASCLNEQGRGGTETVSNARIARTVLFYLAKDWFFEKLCKELKRADENNKDATVGVRLNMFSDVRWEVYRIPQAFPRLTFYDYSKWPKRHGWVKRNYHVTFSYDGTNKQDALRILEGGDNVSVVFYEDTQNAVCGRSAHKQKLPASWEGFPVIDGGLTDWRPSDPKGVVVGLRLLAKTYANRQLAIDSGFAVKVDSRGNVIDEDSLNFWMEAATC